MGNKQGCLLGMLFVLVLVNIVGLYFIIDSNSRFTQAMAQNTVQLGRLEAKLEKMRIMPGVASAGSGAAVSGAGAVGFANAEYRQPQADFGGRRVMSVSSFSGNLNYIVRNESTTANVWSICHDDLATRNLMRPEEFEPEMAERWEQSEDGLSYKIYLRKGILWHPYKDPVTGEDVPAKELTSDDFIFFWETINNKDVPCDPLRSYYQQISSFKKLDRYSFEVVWKEPYFKALEMTLGITALPRHYYRPDPKWTDKEFAQHMKTSARNQFMIGCGPYRLVRWHKGKQMVFERFEDYYGPRPYQDELMIKVVPEKSIALVEMKKGSIDEMGLSPEQWRKETIGAEFKVVTPDINTAIIDSASWDEKKQAGELPQDYRFEKFQYFKSAMPWFYISYNLKNDILADKRVRQSLTMLTDRKRILRDVYFDLGKIINGPFMPNTPYVDPDIKPFDFDPAKAKALLAEAGWKDTDGDGILDKDLNGDGKRVKLSYTVIIANVSANARKMTSIIQADMKKAGIDMQVQPLEWSVMLDRINQKSFDAVTLGWTGVLESDPYQVWHSSQAKIKNSSNHISFANAEADKLIEQGRRTLDLKKRTEIFRKFYRLIHEQQPYTFMIAPVSLVAQSKRFNNSRVYKLGMDSDLQWVPAKLQMK